MSEKTDNAELFDDYLQGKLATEDRSAFEKRLADDRDFMLQFEQHKEEVSLVKMLGIREEINSLLQNVDAQKKGPGKLKLRYLIPLAIAATISLFLIFRPAGKVDNQKLFEQYFEPYPDAITGRNNEAKIEKAMLLYASGQYAKAIVSFQELAPSDTTLFYSSICYLALEKSQEAIDGFNKIEVSSIFYDQSFWYKGLSFLLLEQPDSVLASFKNIKAESKYKNLSEEIVGQFD